MEDDPDWFAQYGFTARMSMDGVYLHLDATTLDVRRWDCSAKKPLDDLPTATKRKAFVEEFKEFVRQSQAKPMDDLDLMRRQKELQVAIGKCLDKMNEPIDTPS